MFALFTFIVLTLSPQELLTKVDSVATTPHSIGIMEQTIITTTGKRRTFKIKFYTKNGMDKQLMVYIFPPQVRGNSFLIIGDNVWAYFPETGRIRKIASHAKKQKMMGSDFTYEDMTIGTYKKKFKPVDMKEEKDSYILTLIPKENAKISYGKLVLKVDKKTYIPLIIDFYRKDEDKPYKTLIQEDIKIVYDIPTPMHIVMRNNETGSETETRTLEIDYRTKVEDGLFSPKKLREVSEE
ncbi:MAG TPA: outer membrane lipoprotein-sorting protein [candidate division WOR-3 bacterium]|uniref:Outer membrane lipoprotein-sorting protein n=1 Tax=candidate division WOR-3 bacterium TaxID=2052148 RepID=A0A7C5H5M9_UNCW3|nr:outer membrane lipoprotein-sorting protein [candidate division WOR-3 bacterium]